MQRLEVTSIQTTSARPVRFTRTRCLCLRQAEDERDVTENIVEQF